MATFGREDVGETPVDLAPNSIRGTVYTCLETGILNSMDIRCNPKSAGDAKCLLYLHSDLSLKATSTARTFTGLEAEDWYTFTFAGEALVNAAYVLCIFPGISMNILRFNNAEVDGYHYQDVAYPNAPDPLVPTHANHQMSIHADYTPSAGVSKKRMLMGVGLMAKTPKFQPRKVVPFKCPLPLFK